MIGLVFVVFLLVNDFCVHSRLNFLIDFDLSIVGKYTLESKTLRGVKILGEESSEQYFEKSII